MRRNILNLNSAEAEAFFLKQKSYISFDMPLYFNFGKVIDEIAKYVNILDFQDIKKAKSSEKVNHIVYSNKDGKYAWRKFEIINPILYVSLVKAITQKKSWKNVIKRINEQKSVVTCLSMPVVGKDLNKSTSLQIEEWLDEVERESIRLALEYEYIYQTDVADCYGSIYTHSIAWALHEKSVAKHKRNSTR